MYFGFSTFFSMFVQVIPFVLLYSLFLSPLLDIRFIVGLAEEIVSKEKIWHLLSLNESVMSISQVKLFLMQVVDSSFLIIIFTSCNNSALISSNRYKNFHQRTVFHALIFLRWCLLSI